MYCAHCGKELAEGAAFCLYCGEPVFNIEEGSESTPISTQEPTNSVSAQEIVSEQTSEPAKEEATQNDGSIGSAFRELANDLGSALFKEDGLTREDSACPFCGEKDCMPFQKNITEVNTTGYKMSYGCCGMLLLGPFGLLCGLCGTGSKVKTSTELWWTCSKCGKQHLALADALQKWDVAVSGLPVTGLLGGILFILFRWLANEFFALFYLCAIFVLALPVIALIGTHQEISEGLGVPILDYLSAAQKKKCVVMALLSVLVALVVGLLGIPLLVAFLGE